MVALSWWWDHLNRGAAALSKTGREKPHSRHLIRNRPGYVLARTSPCRNVQLGRINARETLEAKCVVAV